MDIDMGQSLTTLKKWIDQSQSIVFFGGAGVSTESNIPDFRSPDGLHQMAGSRNVLELHGSAQRNYCLDCGAFYDLAFMLRAEPGVPRCADCGGIVRPDVVLYEEMLPEDVVIAAEKAIRSADMMIVGGTSLVVYPAAGLVRLFKGSRLVLINKQETDYDDRAGLVLREPIGQVLDDLL